MSSKNQFEKYIESLEGVWTALITPMEAKGDKTNLMIDYEKFFEIIDQQIDAGINGLLVLGTTGQGPTMDEYEHYEVIKKAIYYIDGRVPVMLGAGSNATNQAFNLSDELITVDKNRMPILLHVTGYYNNPPQAGLYMHFKYLAENLPDTPMVIYNVPGRTSNDIDKDVVLELADKYPNIIGIKYAKPKQLDVVDYLVQQTNPDKFRVMSGNDDEFYDFLELGAHGIISAAACALPSPFIDIYQLHTIGENEKAKRKQQKIDDIIKAVYAPKTKNPMALNYMFDSALRSPLLNIESGFDVNDDYEAKKYAEYEEIREMIKAAMKNHYNDLLPLAQETYKNL